MKTILVWSVWTMVTSATARAQLPVVEALKNVTAKIIKAIDLKVQRWQNETIALQNAQQALENVLEKTKLQEIGSWMNKQKTLYADYFEELSQVKSAVATYHRVKELVTLQSGLVREYRSAFALFKNDRHFTAAEIAYMEQVYAAILKESIDNMACMQLVLQAFTTTMSDAQRMRIIDQAAEQVRRNYSDLQAFNNQNKLLSLQRAKSEEDIHQVKTIYGME
jgi:hypothetical protein